MADRVFDRAFSRAAASNAEEAERPARPRKQVLKGEAGAAGPPPTATPMQVSDAIQRVLLADKDKDCFRYILQVCSSADFLEPAIVWQSQTGLPDQQLLATQLTICRLMELPLPEADELGRPAWSVTSADISKSYRRLSVLVHPDKNPGEDARKAFEALNETYRKLRDPSQLVSVQHFLAEPPHLMASSSCFQATCALLTTQLYALFVHQHN